jgi:hypothetical protein
VTSNAIRRLQALGLAGGMVLWSGGPGRRHPLMQAPLAAVLVSITKVPLGFRPPTAWAGLRVGSAAAALVTASVAVGTAIPRVRTAMADRTPPAAPAAWLAVRIPVGTVWSEEAAYRGALATLAAEGCGPRAGRLLQAVAFGLSHIPDARAAGEPVLGTVMVTGIAGWVFGWLAERSGSLLAPLLAHLAINEAGAVAALAVRSARSRR